MAMVCVDDALLWECATFSPWVFAPSFFPQIEDSIETHFGHRSGRAVLFKPLSHGRAELETLQDLLHQHGYSVVTVEERLGAGLGLELLDQGQNNKQLSELLDI